MIFTKSQTSKVLAGLQTRTTRPAGFRVALGSAHPIQQGNFGPTVGWVRVVGISLVRLSSLTPEDIHDEGFQSLAAFKAHWRQVLGRWQADLEIKSIRFVLVDRPERHRSQTTLFDEEADPDA